MNALEEFARMFIISDDICIIYNETTRLIERTLRKSGEEIVVDNTFDGIMIYEVMSL
jgi:hypothetical protein